ncbi:hypothetical protein CRE_12354 [Caenorhabditis remanei]|uniref:Uncharacterized protein n=1 Tax=Caenorhabditis remanei TaxID=31234 RepID=E3NL58_CAERE|nr:hypothetical protein CRE_12354 [Caenorhabditis remanei]
MPARPKPLFYETAKCVALYMDPNVRLQLYFRCPQFRNVHRSQTLRIKDLKVRPENFEIDGTIYKLGVITQYTNKPNRSLVTLSNSGGGLQWDLDVYGLPIETRNETRNMPDDNEQVAILQRQIKILEEKLRNKELQPDDIKRIKIKIEVARWEIERLQTRISKSPPPYRNYLQMTVRTGEDIKLERVVYEKQLKLTREYIEKRVFSNGNIRVRNLQIGEDSYAINLVDLIENGSVQADVEPLFRYAPQGDKVKPLLSIREGCLEVGVLKVTGNVTNALVSLQKVLSSVPLKQLRTVHQPFPNDPIIKTSQLVLIVGCWPFTVLSSCPNNRTHIEATLYASNNQFTNVVNKWMESDMSVGTYYSIGFYDVYYIEKDFFMWRKLPGAQSGKNKETRLTIFPECVIIPMKNDTELNVYFNEANEEEREYCRTRFIVKMKWQPRGYARAGLLTLLHIDSFIFSPIRISERMTQPPSKPLFYETSRCVALYLKSTIRIQLYLRCPAFQTIHRTQNFRVADLKIRPEDFEIDGTVFQLGILRHYLFGNVPESTTWKNAAGGDRHDIDKYGLPILAQNGQQVPTDAQYIEQLEQQALLLERNGPRSSRALTEDDVKSHRMDIERKRLKIQSYELRMRNEKPPFQHFVELAMTCGEEKNSEFVAYEKTLQEIKDYILHKIFTIDAKGFIGNLQIGDDAFNRYLAWHIQNPRQLFPINPVFQAQMAAQNFFMPLPGLVPEVPPVFQEQPRVADVVPLLKLRAESVEVHRLVVTGNIENALASLKPFRCETPLKELKVSAQPYPDDPVLRTAQLLNIVSASRMIQIRNLQNSRIHFDQLVCDEQEFHVFMRMMEEAETMRYYSFEFSELKDLNFLVKRFRNLPGAERDDFAEIRSTNLPKHIVIPLINQKELNIYVEETSMEDTKYCDTPFIVKIKV